MMKRLFALVILSFYLIAPAWAADTAYFSFLPDLPLAPDLREDPNTSVRFDQPEGRIIVLQASGKSPVQAVKSFYFSTLPALGWIGDETGRYVRNGEVMILGIQEQASGLTKVNILVRPE